MRCVVLAAGIAATILSGCAGMQSAEPTASGTAVSENPAVEPRQGRRWLERGIAQFEQGRFVESLRLLQESPEILADVPAVRAEALKYIAFGYCVTGRRAACRRSFDALLVLDASFVLSAAEAGHPSWGQEFDRARAALRQPAGAPLRPAR
jgi:hypothetical protein